MNNGGNSEYKYGFKVMKNNLKPKAMSVFFYKNQECHCKHRLLSVVGFCYCPCYPCYYHSFRPLAIEH
jgi:hypothetical protein